MAKRYSIFLLTVLLLLGILSALAVAQTEQPDGLNEDFPQDADEVLRRSAEALQALVDLSADVEIIQYEGRRQTTTVAHLKASQTERVARLEISAPRALRGQIVVADQSQSRVSVYLPVADQIVVREFEDFGENLGLGVDITDLSSLVAFHDLTISLEDVEENEEMRTYVVKVEGFEDQTQYIWIDGEDWIPRQVTIYKGDKLIGELKLSNISLNQNLSPENLLELPSVRTTYQ